MKIITAPQAALLRYLFQEAWDVLSFYPLDVFPSRTNADNANRRMLSRLHEAGCLKMDDDGRFVMLVGNCYAALDEWPWG